MNYKCILQQGKWRQSFSIAWRFYDSWGLLANYPVSDKCHSPCPSTKHFINKVWNNLDGKVYFQHKTTANAGFIIDENDRHSEAQLRETNVSHANCPAWNERRHLSAQAHQQPDTQSQSTLMAAWTSGFVHEAVQDFCSFPNHAIYRY